MSGAIKANNAFESSDALFDAIVIYTAAVRAVRVMRLMSDCQIRKDSNGPPSELKTTWDEYTVLVLRMAHRKRKETKQQPSMLPGPAVPGSCLVSFHILWAILSTSTVRLISNIRYPTHTI